MKDLWTKTRMGFSRAIDRMDDWNAKKENENFRRSQNKEKDNEEKQKKRTIRQKFGDFKVKKHVKIKQHYKKKPFGWSLFDDMI